MVCTGVAFGKASLIFCGIVFHISSSSPIHVKALSISIYLLYRMVNLSSNISFEFLSCASIKSFFDAFINSFITRIFAIWLA